MITKYTTFNRPLPAATINNDNAFIRRIESDYWFNHGATKDRKEFIRDLKKKQLLGEPRVALQNYRNIIKEIHMMASIENKQLFEIMMKYSDLEIEKIKKKSFEYSKKLLNKLKNKVQELYGKDFVQKAKAQALKVNVERIFV